jgi:HlyD family secretion protein
MKLKTPSSKVIALVLLGVLLMAAVVFVVMRAGPLAPVRVTVVQATEGTLTPALYGIGTVEARRSYFVGPTAAGRVLRVLVDVGDTVKTGQLLSEMDPVDLDNRLSALDASVARASSVIAAADAQTADAAARKELAAIAARRYQELRSRGQGAGANLCRRGRPCRAGQPKRCGAGPVAFEGRAGGAGATAPERALARYAGRGSRRA